MMLEIRTGGEVFLTNWIRLLGSSPVNMKGGHNLIFKTNFMKKYSIHDSLGEIIAHVTAPKKSFAISFANERYPSDNPKVKLVKTN